MIGRTAELMEQPVREFVRGFAPDADPAEQEQIVEKIVDRQSHLAGGRKIMGPNGYRLHCARKRAAMLAERGLLKVSAGVIARWLGLSRRTALDLKKRTARNVERSHPAPE